ncbi:MAG: D-glycero-beta-D-manno-heptose-7-phosphate kinase [bacterium]
MDKKKLLKILDRMNNTSVMVLGDIMMDKFVWGKVSRISPEAPVPIVEIEKETHTPGGAGNVAMNVCSLDSKVLLVGVIGNDFVGDKLINEMSRGGIDTTGVFRDDKRPTILKTRIIAQHQQVVRTDREIIGKLSAQLTKQITTFLDENISRVKAVVISDYGKGVISPVILKKAVSLARKHKKPIVVDPKVEHFQQYKQVSCITPNQSEAALGMREHSVPEGEGLIKLGKTILKKLHCESLLVTQGEKGMLLFESRGKITHIPTVARDVFDVSGAGDTVIAVLTLALAAKASILDAAQIANYAAGIVVGKLGTATTSIKEIKNKIRG